jgi:cytochrome bd ubiquinol oxidase subunit I
MADALFWHRLQFAFTVVYHYLFPQLTMGLALLIVVMKILALRSGERGWDRLARFWAKIFGVNFAVGVVTGIPMEMQLAANWGRLVSFSGGVLGQTLALEGTIAFFLESSLLYLFLRGEGRLGRRAHLGVAVGLWLGTWLSGYFIVTTNAFMQHPVGYTLEDGRLAIASLRAFLLNPWALVAYAHTMIASVLTASFVLAGVSALWCLRGQSEADAARGLRLAARVGVLAAVAVAFPSGDQHAKLVARHQPITLAAMEGRFDSGPRAEITLVGQPNLHARRLDNPIRIPGVLSFLAYGSFHAEVRGLGAYPESEWPQNIELLYYAFHVMAGLGTIFIALFAVSALVDLRGRLARTRPLLWALVLSMPLPYIATTCGWMTAELGRQPWVIHGLLRTADATSPQVHAGSTLFTLVGFAGLYLVVGVLFLFLVAREIAHGLEHP